MASRVRHVKTPVCYTVVTSNAVNLAVLHVTSAGIPVAGRVHITSVDFRVIGRVHDHHVIVLVRAFCHVDIAVLDSAVNRVSALSAIARYVSLPSYVYHTWAVYDTDRHDAVYVDQTRDTPHL